MTNRSTRLATVLFVGFLSLALILSSFTPASSQGDPERTPAPEFGGGNPPGGQSPARRRAGINGEPRIVVKFNEGTGVRLRGGQLTVEPGIASAPASLSTVQTILLSTPNARLSRLFTAPESTLDAQRAQGIANTGQPLADLNLYYALDLPASASDQEVQRLIAALKADPSVQTAYEEPGPVALASDIPPTTPNFQSNQFYLNPAPVGVDATYGWTIPGGTGTNVTVVDVEYQWEFAHEDMPITASDLIVGEQFTGFGPDHGSAVMGILSGINNGYGVTGISHGATAKVAGTHFSGFYNLANSISLLGSAPATAAGDIILIEQQASPPGSLPPCPTGCSCGSDPFRYVPIEYYQANYDAVAATVAAGRIIVLTAGNGYNNLDWNGWSGLFTRSVRDSGAIYVGAGLSGFNGNTPERGAHCYSNHGTRIDVQGIGDSITTTGYGNLFNGDSGSGPDARQLYTSSFSGTSSSGPIVAGAAAVLQSIAKQNGFTLTPARMRSILRATGYAQVVTSNGILVGPRPNLRKAIAALLRPDTVGIFRPSNSTFFLRNSNTTGPANLISVFGATNDLPVAGDWDGDGVDTIGVYRPSTAQFFLRNSNANGAPLAHAFTLGSAGDVPMAGDWDGDGRDGVGVFRPTNGRLFLRNTLSTGFADWALIFGTVGDRPVAGDWDGDGKDSPSIYRPSTSTFFLTDTICNCVPTANRTFRFGDPNDVPLSGDWNSDGISGIGVFRPTNGIVYLRNTLSTGFADVSIVYGIANDRPIAGKWIAP